MSDVQSHQEVSDFAKKVYAACSRVPVGRVISYGELAKAIGVRSPQAIGQALRCNPFAPDVPCHRVVRADGSMGGYLGDESGEDYSKKRDLLAAEGVMFDSSGVIVDRTRMVTAGALT